MNNVKIYSLTEFPNNKVDLEKLTFQIKNSHISNTLDYILSDEEKCYIYFKDDLNDNDLIILNGIVLNHDGERLFNKKYRIYECIKDKSYDPYIPPHDIDFTILGLHRVPYVENGELKRVVYYKTARIENGQKVFLDPVVEKNIEYTKINGYYFSRKTTIYWYYEDGEIDNVWKKEVMLYYTNDEAIEAGNKRRNYAVKSVQIDVVGLIQMLHVADSGITSTGSNGNILIDETKIFTDEYIGRIVEIDNNKYKIMNVSGNTLILNNGANVQENKSYIIRLTIKQADKWGTQYMSLIANEITKYIMGDVDVLKNVLLTTDNYNSSITYFYGQSCIKDDKYWICNVSSVSGEWDPDKWKIEVDFSWIGYIIPGLNITIRQYLLSKLIE